VRWLVPLLVCGGCKWVYDAQYDDRADELDAFRSDFLPASDRVSFLTSTDHHVFWISLVKPLDETMLHSFAPASGTRVDYELTRGQSNIDQNYRLSDSLVVQCGFSAAKAFDIAQPNTQIDMTDQGSDVCTVDGRDVYFDRNRAITKWTPGGGVPVQVVDLDAQMVGTDTVGGMSVVGHQMLLEEGGRLWQIDLTTGHATWLENPDVQSGEVASDATGVVFDSAQGPTREVFADHSTAALADLIANGGYELNFEHADIQEIGDFAEYSLVGTYVIYRSKSGIFAYGFQSTKVIDLLLDRGEGFDATALYHHPAATADNALFVQDTSSLSANGQPVYRVDLTGRLP